MSWRGCLSIGDNKGLDVTWETERDMKTKYLYLLLITNSEDGFFRRGEVCNKSCQKNIKYIIKL